MYAAFLQIIFLFCMNLGVLFTGVLFCVGGRGASGDPYKTIECYHPMKGRWFQVTEMNTRRRHVGVCSYNGNHTARYNKNSNIFHGSS